MLLPYPHPQPEDERAQRIPPSPSPFYTGIVWYMAFTTEVPFHHLIPDVLTLPWRPAPPTHPHPTVTYGEGYVTMTSPCQLCPSSCPVHVPTTATSSTPQLCPSRPVHIFHHNITRQLAAHAASVMLIKITWAIHTSVAPLI